MRSYLIIFFFVLLSFGSLHAEEMPNPEVEKYFVILASNSKYPEAKTRVEKASQSLKIKLDLRGLIPDKKMGLSFDKKTCEAGPTQEFPCYNPRGKFDDGEYLSIEHTTAYREMKPGLFIVVAYSGEKKDAEAALKKTILVYKDAYLKKTKVYMAGE